MLSLALIGIDVVGPQAEARRAKDLEATTTSTSRASNSNATLGGSAWSAPAGALLGPLIECLEADGKAKREGKD